MLRRILIMLILLVSIGGAIGYGVQQYLLSVNNQKPPIRSVRIDRSDIIYTVNATGNIAPERSARLTFDTPGLVAEVLVTEGQSVKQGDLLAQQDNVAQKLALAQAESSLDAAELALNVLLKPLDAKDLAVAEANVKAARDTYNALATSISSSTIKSAELRYQQAKAAWDDAIENRRSAGGRYAQNSPTYQLALAQEGQASFASEIARLQWEILKRGVDGRALSAAAARIKQAETALAQLKAGLPQQTIDQAQITIEQAKTAVNEAKRQLAKTELRAPFSGIITAVTAKTGSLAISGVPSVVLTDISQLHIDIRVDEVDIALVQIGQKVALKVDALPNAPLSGYVERINEAANTDSTVITYTVRVALDPTTEPIKVGMTTSATITIRELKQVLRIPNIFVRIDRRNNQAYANLVQADGTLTEVPITLGLKNEEYSEVIAGLVEGDSVGVSTDTSIDIFN